MTSFISRRLPMEDTILSPVLGNFSGVEDVVRWNVNHVNEAMQRFDWPDYLVFVLMLLICVVIGVYFGFIHTTQTELDYLVGGRTMKIFPVGMSLIASFISGISLLGIPTEIYVYGIQYIYILIGVVLMAIVFQNIFLPVFHNLQLTSTFEYLEKRFNRHVRKFGSILCIIGTTTWLPVVIYVPALAFNQALMMFLNRNETLIILPYPVQNPTNFFQLYINKKIVNFLVTGINVHLVTPIVCIICIFYTCVGGLKAVVWTDVIQTIVMIGAMILVAVKGTIDIGGFNVVWNSNVATGRLEPPVLDPSPFTRHTLWSLGIGGMSYYLQTSAVSQLMIQRYLSLPTLKAANRALWMFVIGIVFLIGICAYCGLLIFATYQDCDPITTQLARQKDQLLPLLVMDVVGNYPGLPGLFVAGIFSAALSSLSTGLNSLVAVVLEDFYRPMFKKELTEGHKQIVMKSTVVILGMIFVGLVFVVEKLGTVLQLTMSIGTISSGPSLALFTMGMLLPWINSTSALIGSFSGLAFMSWLTLSVQAAIGAGKLTFEEKPVSTTGCHYDFIPRIIPPALSLLSEDGLPLNGDENDLPMFYHLSYLWYTLIGLIVSCSVGLIAAFVGLGQGPLDPRDIDPALLAPIVRKLIKPREFPNQPQGDEIILAYEPKTYKISTISTSNNSLPTYKSTTTAS